MSTGGSFQPALFDGSGDAGTGAVMPGGLVAGQQESTEGSEDRCSRIVALAGSGECVREPTPVRVGGRAADGLVVPAGPGVDAELAALLAVRAREIAAGIVREGLTDDQVTAVRDLLGPIPSRNRAGRRAAG